MPTFGDTTLALAVMPTVEVTFRVVGATIEGDVAVFTAAAWPASTAAFRAGVMVALTFEATASVEPASTLDDVLASIAAVVLAVTRALPGALMLADELASRLALVLASTPALAAEATIVLPVPLMA